MRDVTEQDVLAINCMAQHIRAFRDQAQNGMKADFAEPCSFCRLVNKCNFDWIGIMYPVLKYGTETKLLVCLDRNRNEIEFLKQMNRDVLIEVRNTLNHWNWPDQLGCKPDGWDEMPNYRKPHMGECKTKEDIIRPYMVILAELLKTKPCL